MLKGPCCTWGHYIRTDDYFVCVQIEPIHPPYVASWCASWIHRESVSIIVFAKVQWVWKYVYHKQKVRLHVSVVALLFTGILSGTSKQHSDVVLRWSCMYSTLCYGTHENNEQSFGSLFTVYNEWWTLYGGFMSYKLETYKEHRLTSPEVIAI